MKSPALIVQFEVLQCGERVLIAIDPVLLGFIHASAVALIEVGAASLEKYGFGTRTNEQETTEYEVVDIQLYQ